MRDHLIKCFESSQFSPFPKIRKMPKMPTGEPRISVLKLYCICKLPAIFDDMVKCSNNKCQLKCFHKRCVKFANEENWVCSSELCSNSN